MKRNYTKIDQGIFQCNDCGAHAANIKAIKHFKTCVPGESAKWEKINNDDRIEDLENQYFDTRW